MTIGMNAMQLHQPYQEKYDIEFDTWYLLGFKLHKLLIANKIKHKYFRNNKQTDVLRFENKKDYELAHQIYKEQILGERLGHIRTS